jgi:hypothetical protein
MCATRKTSAARSVRASRRIALSLARKRRGVSDSRHEAGCGWGAQQQPAGCGRRERRKQRIASGGRQEIDARGLACFAHHVHLVRDSAGVGHHERHFGPPRYRIEPGSIETVGSRAFGEDLPHHGVPVLAIDERADDTLLEAPEREEWRKRRGDNACRTQRERALVPELARGEPDQLRGA